MLTYLHRNLAALADLTGRGRGRFAVDGIRVRDSGTGLYQAEATNGKALAIVQDDQSAAQDLSFRTGRGTSVELPPGPWTCRR